MPLPSAQHFINSAELHAFIDLPPGLYGPLRIDKPVLINAKDSTFWSEDDLAAVTICCAGAGLFNATLRKTLPTKTVVLAVHPNCQPTFQNVKIEGSACGLDPSLGEWNLPAGIELLDLPGTAAGFDLHLQTGLPARIATRIAGIDFEPRNIDPGSSTVRVHMRDLNLTSILTGDIELISGEITHLIPISAKVGTPPRNQPFPDSADQSGIELDHAWHETHSEKAFPSTTLNPYLQFIPGGDFVMGNPKEPDSPLRRVSLSAFYMEETPVTHHEWHEVKQWALSHGYDFQSQESAYGIDHPIWQITWYDALKWCNARSEMLGLTPCYYTDREWSEGTLYKTGELDLSDSMVDWNADGYRLPTEAEWEKAARGGLERQKYPLGNKLAPNDARFRQSDTVPVRTYPANGYGLYEMSGNIAEWCWDWYDPDPTGFRANPRGPRLGSQRVTRGGTFTDFAVDCRVFSRACSEPECPGFIGLRVVSAKNTRAPLPDIPAQTDQFPTSKLEHDTAQNTARKNSEPFLPLNETTSTTLSYVTLDFPYKKKDSANQPHTLEGISEQTVPAYEWKRIAEWAVQNGYSFKNTPTLSITSAACISWLDALIWCNSKSESEGKRPFYYIQSPLDAGQEIDPSNIPTAPHILRSDESSEVVVMLIDPDADGYRLPYNHEWEWVASCNRLVDEDAWEWCLENHPQDPNCIHSITGAHFISLPKPALRAAQRSNLWKTRQLLHADAATGHEKHRAFRIVCHAQPQNAQESGTEIEPVFAQDESLESSLESLHANVPFTREIHLTQPPQYGEWTRVRNWGITRGYRFEQLGTASSKTDPVEGIGWRDLVKWCNAKSEMEGLQPCYFISPPPEPSHIFNKGRISLSELFQAPAANGYRLDPPLTHLEGHWSNLITY
jgi:formylglycine-generating enzyme required for sulfatase activity